MIRRFDNLRGFYAVILSESSSYEPENQVNLSFAFAMQKELDNNKHKEQIKEANKNYRQSHKQEIKKYQKQWRG